MRDKLSGLVIDFFNRVSYYIMEEYPDYYNSFHNEKKLAKTFEIIKGYYLGGNNAEDTARYMVDYLKGKENGRPI